MAELFHFVAAAVELPVPRACATACKLAQLHALSRLCQYRPAGPPKMHAQNDTKMHSDECKGRSLRFCVRAKQRVRFCVRAEQRVATIVGFRTLSSANVCSTNAFSFLCSPGWVQGIRERKRSWDLRRKKKKKNRASRGLNVIFALSCFLLQTAHWSRSRKHLGKCFRKSPHALHSNRSERPDEQTDQDYPQVSVSSYIQTSFALYGQRCSPS